MILKRRRRHDKLNSANAPHASRQREKQKEAYGRIRTDDLSLTKRVLYR